MVRRGWAQNAWQISFANRRQPILRIVDMINIRFSFILRLRVGYSFAWIRYVRSLMEQ